MIGLIQKNIKSVVTGKAQQSGRFQQCLTDKNIDNWLTASFQPYQGSNTLPVSGRVHEKFLFSANSNIVRSSLVAQSVL